VSALIEHGDDLWSGFVTTVLLTLCAYPLALVIGALLAVCRISPVGPLRVAARLYVDVIRNAPLLLILVMIVFALPDAGLLISLFWSLVLGLGIYSGAYVCETIRSGIRAVDRGQVEAARAIGLPFRRVVTDLLLPQALRAMVQPLGTILINTALGSALGAAVGVRADRRDPHAQPGECRAGCRVPRRGERRVPPRRAPAVDAFRQRQQRRHRTPADHRRRRLRRRARFQQPPLQHDRVADEPAFGVGSQQTQAFLIRGRQNRGRTVY
jgi:glutamate transport system permease protein